MADMFDEYSEFGEPYDDEAAPGDRLQSPRMIALRRTLRALRLAGKATRERNPRGLLRLAGEVRLLAETARRVCPPERRLQARISALLEESTRLMDLAVTPEFRWLDTARRRQLRNGLVLSRESLLRAMSHAQAPSTLLQ